MNFLACVGLLICAYTAYASGLPSPADESSFSLKVAPETPGEVLAPEESRGYGGYGGYGGGGYGRGGYGGGGYGGGGYGGGGYGGGWGGGRGGGGGWGGRGGWGR